MNQNSFRRYSDKEIVEKLLKKDQFIIEHFLYEKCAWLIYDISRKVFNFKIDNDELISEFYLLLSQKDWSVIRQFRHESSLMTYLKKVAFRYFINNKKRLIEKEGEDSLYNQKDDSIMDKPQTPESKLISYIDIIDAIDRVPNKRYRLLLKDFLIKELEPNEIAQKWNITIDNYYNMKRRALAQLVNILKEGGYNESK